MRACTKSVHAQGRRFSIDRPKPKAAFVALDHCVAQARSLNAARKNSFYKFQRARAGRRKTVRDWRDFEQQMIAG
jgi:hypothetical protein